MELLLTADPRIGTEIAGYRLEALLGRGGMGVVYLAQDPWLERRVAMKLVAPELSRDARFRKRFLTESRIAASLEYAEVVPIYEAGEADGHLYLAMRYIDGTDLKCLLEENGRLDPTQTISILERVAVALDAAHAKGLVHRDVKPGNVLLGRKLDAALPRDVYLSDFGLASRAEDEERTEAGTLDYLAPEQIEGKPASARTDVYSLGCVLYHCLIGEAPYLRHSRMELLWAHLEDDPPRPSERRSGLPERFDAVIARALAKEPQGRYSSCRELVEAAARALGHSAGTSELTAARNPYKGLRPFEEADADEFFGRESLIETLLERLADPTGGRFLAVVGPSGSGKSSLLRAGLLPRLRQGAVVGSEGWLIAQLVPGPDPFGDLTATLRSAASPNDGVLDGLGEDPTALSRAVERLLPDDGSELLVFIDQFEELFTLAGEDVRASLLASFTHAVSDPSGRLRLVIALRADFYDRPLRYREFGALLEAGQENVHPLSPAELEQAITRPAEAVGVALEPGLVADIVADVAEQPSALPLLQYALTELFERRESGTLTAEAYARVGGVSGALAYRAEQLYGELDVAGREAARKLFTRLVALGEGRDDTRRRVRREEVEELGGATPAIEGVIDAFGSQRLLSFDRDPMTHSPTVEIAHEALLREWPRLKAWFDEDRDGLRLLRHLSEAALAWQKLDRDPGELYRGARLENALAWADAHPDDLHPREREFLDRARARRDEDERAARDQAEQRIRQNRRLRVALGVVAVGLVGALIAGVLAVRARNDEADARFEAETGRLVAESASILPKNRRLALLLAAEAHRRDPSVESLGALQRALTGSLGFLGYLGPGRIYEEVAFSDGDSRLVGVSPQGIDVYDLAESRLLSRIELATPPSAAAVSAGGRLAAVATNSVVRVYDLAAGPERRQSFALSAPVTALTFSPRLDRLASGAADGTVVIWDLSSGTRDPQISAHDLPIRELAFSRDGALLATSSNFRPGTPAEPMVARVWDARTGAKVGGDLAPPRNPAEDWWGVSAIEFGSNATLFVGGQRAARRWNVRTGRQLEDIRHPDLSARVDPTQESAIVDIALIGDSTAALGTGAKVTLVNVETGKALGNPLDSQLRVSFSDPAVRNLAVSADHSTLAVAGENGIALWSLDGRQLIARALPRGDAAFAVVEAEGSRLVANSSFGRPPTAWNIAVDPPVRMPFSSESGFGLFADEGEVLYTKPGFSETSAVEPLRFWNPVTLAPTGVSVPPGEFADSGDDANSRIGAFAVGDGALVKVFDLDTGRRLAELEDLLPPGEGEDRSVWTVDFSPDGKRLVGTTAQGHAIVWNTSTYKPIGKPLSAEPGGVQFAYYSPDGRYLLTSAADGTILLRDTVTHEPIGAPLVGHRGPVIPVGAAFNADSTRLVTAGADGQTLLWDVESRTLIGDPWPGGEGGSASPDGRFIVTLVGEHILLWDPKTDLWAGIACRAAGRAMTPVEWKELGPSDEDYRATCR